MNFLRVNKSCGVSGMRFEEGKTYVYAGETALKIEALLNARIGGAAEFDPTPFDIFYRQYKGESLAGKKILIWRFGGLGDLLFLTPALRWIKKHWPTAYVIVACNHVYADIFEGHPHIDEVRPFPVSRDWLEETDYHLYFEGVIENNQAAARINAIDLFNSWFNFRDIPENERQPELSVSSRALERADRLLKLHKFEPSDFVVACHWKVGAPVRRYPWEWMVETAKDLVNNHGAKVIWLSEPKHAAQVQEWGVEKAGLEGKAINQMIRESDQTWQMTAALIARSDLVLSADSSPLHIAGSRKGVIQTMQPGATEVPHLPPASPWEFHETTPSLGIYGPFLSFQRLKYYPMAVGIDPDVPCAGCNQHGGAQCPFAGQDGISPCFYKVPPKLLTEYAGRMMATIEVMRANYGLPSKTLLALEPMRHGLAAWQEELMRTKIKGSTLKGRYVESLMPLESIE